MKMDEIRNKILQLAIQGKLVPQDENDEPAAVLLEKIQAEKEQLIQEKKIKKEKPLPEISDEEKVFEIPKGWEWVRLQSIAYVNGGFAFKSKEFSEEGVRVIRISDFNERGFIDNKIVRHKYNETLESYRLEEKNILLCMTGGTVGKSYFVKELVEPMVTNQRVATIKVFKNIHAEYINYFILSPLTQNIIRMCKNSTNDNISMDTINSFVVPLPPLEEQKRIADKVEELFAIVNELSENREAMAKCIADTKSKVLQLAIQGKLVEQDAEDEPASVLLERIRIEKEKLIQEKKIKKEKPLPEIREEEKAYEIPEGWEWCRLDSIGTTNIGLTYKPSDISDIGIPVLRSSNIQNGKMDYDDLVCVSSEVPENKMCKIGDILICARNGSKRLVGKCALIDREGMSFGAFMAIFRSEYNKYINIFLNSELFRNQLGDSNTVTINQITQSMLRSTVCPLPPLEEQKRIVAKVEQVMNYLDLLEQLLLA